MVVEAEAVMQVVHQLQPGRGWLVLVTPIPRVRGKNQSTHLDREGGHRATCRQGQVLVCVAIGDSNIVVLLQNCDFANFLSWHHPSSMNNLVTMYLSRGLQLSLLHLT